MKNSGKSRKTLIVGIVAAVVILAALLVLLLTRCSGDREAAKPTETTAQAPDASYALYWNVDRALYDGKSEAGMSSRAADEDGCFSVKFILDGQEVTLKVANRKLINTIDTQDVMDLEFDENGIVVGVVLLDDLPLEKVAWQFYVQSAASGVLKLNSSESMNGMEVMLENLDPNIIWDMTGKSGPVGCVAEPIKMDRVMVVANLDGKVTHIFIYDRTYYMNTHEAYCQHCEKTVEWYEWVRTNSVPKESGHYQLHCDILTTGQTSFAEDTKICLDLNGHRIDGKENSRVISLHNAGCELAVMDTSEKQEGVIAAHGKDNQGVCIWVRNGEFYFYSGTVDASDVTGTFGTALSCEKNTYTYMYGGRIIGGTAMWTQNEKNGSYGNGIGGALSVSGKFVMYDGVIKKGRAVSAVTYKNGTPSYQRGLGGNIFLSSGSVFEMNGGTIKGGVADSIGGNIYADGTAEVTINGGVIYGGTVTGSTRFGGNLYLGGKTLCTINGGSILDGNAKGHSGNVYAAGKVIMNGGYIGGGFLRDEKTGAVIKDAPNGNVFLVNATMHMYGGSIKGGMGITDTSATDSKTATLLLSGYATIAGGPGGKNLNISNNRVKVIVGTLYESAKIGVSTNVGIFTEPTKEKYLANFTSDMEGADVLYYDGCLALGRLGCICGNTKGAVIAEDHKLGCDGKQLLWAPYTKAGELPVSTGNYYLMQDVTSTKQTVVPMDQDVKLDLNGWNVTFKVPASLTGGYRLYRADYNAKLAITDTTETPGTLRTVIPAKGTKYTGGKLLKSETKDENGQVVQTYFEPGSPEEQAEAERLWANGDFGMLLWARGGKIAIHNGIFDGSNLKATRTGGMTMAVNAISSENKETGEKTTYCGQIDFYDGVIKCGTVTNVGNIQVNPDTTFHMYGGTVTGGTATQGGNFQVLGVLKLQGGTVSDGTGTGGNIYIAENGKVELTGGTVSGGLSQNAKGERTDGGNFYVAKGGTLQILGGTVTGGLGNTGGNIYAGGTVRVTGGIVEKGEALDAGGNIGTNNGNSQVTVGGDAIIRLGNAKQGGNLSLFVRGNNGFTVEGNAQILDGAATAYGGNIDVNAWLDKDACIELKGGTVSGGKAPLGGNVYVAGSKARFLAQGGTVVGGKAPKGGNVYVTGNGSEFILKGAAITGGEATGTDGGNVYLIDGAHFLMEDGLVSGGKGRDGGNFYMGADTVLEITGGTVTGGKSGASGSGGNIAVGQATLTVTGGLIEKGEANKGGNINTNNVNASITISDKARIEKGHATSRGGNLCVDMRGCKKLEIGGEAKITGGTATTYGGNICLYINGAGTKKAGTFTMTGGTVEGGAAKHGDNVFVLGCDATYTGTFVLSGGTVGAGGEGSCGNSIYLNDQYSFLQLGSATVKGGIHAEKGKVILKDAPTVDKTGSTYIYSLRLAKGNILDAKALTGGKVYVSMAPAEGMLAVTTQENGAAALAAIKGEDPSAPIVLHAGTELHFAKVYCLCGQTDHTWWCDGDHSWIEWNGKTITESGYYYLPGSVTLNEVPVGKADGDVAAVIDLNGCTLTGNGRAFHVLESDSLAITDTQGNGKVTGCGTANNEAGGVILCDANASLALYAGQLEAVQKTGRSAAQGGVVALQSGAKLHMFGGVLTGGRAIGNKNDKIDPFGGSVYIGKDAAFNLYGGTVSGGTAVQGGNIYVEAGGSLRMARHEKDTENKAVRLITGGTANGATYVDANALQSSHGGNIFTKGTVEILDGSAVTDGKALANHKVGTGSGYSIGGNMKISGGTVTIDSGRVTGGICEAKNPANGGYEWAPGGNLYMEGGAKVYVKGGAEISGGNANHGGAGGDGNNIYLTGKSTMELDACVIRNTVAGVSSTRYSINADNGTLYIREGALITNASGVANILNLRTGTNNTTNIYMSGGTIENGTAGNVYLYTNDTFTMSGGLITGGKASSGGNVYVTGANAKFTLTDGEIAEGEATSTDGGNVHLADKAFFLMEGGKVSGGSARDGGNFYMGTDTVLEITGGTVTGGESGASGSGGNIAVGQATLIVSGGLIEKGEANKGGNINTNNVGASITISNKARIEKGHATSRGGNLCVDMRGCKKLEIGGEAKITGGTATTYGGNIAIFINGAGTKKAGILTMTGGTVEGGAAKYGDNVFVLGCDATYTGAFVLSGGTVGAGGEGSCGNSIYLNDQYSFLQLGSATVKGGIHAEKGNVTLKNAPTVDKTGTGYTYGIKLGSAMDVAGLTGGKVYVTAAFNALVGKNAASGTLASYVLSEITYNGLPVDVTWYDAEKALYLGDPANTYCTCGATRTSGYSCHCEDADKGEHLWRAWTKPDSLPTATGNYYLTGNVELSTVSKPAAGAVIRMDLRGKQIILAGDENLYDLADVSGVKLVITDSAATPGAVVITGTTAADGGILDLSAGNSFSLYRAGLDAKGLTSTGKGSVANVQDGATLTVFSGNVTGGTAAQGGVVALQSGAKLQMFGGVLTGGRAIGNKNDKIDPFGGNVYIAKDAAFNLYGGTVSGGTATQGGNVYVEAGGSLRMARHEKDTENKAVRLITGGTANGATYVDANALQSSHGGNIFTKGTVEILDGSAVTDGKALANHKVGTGVGYSIGGNMKISGGTVTIDGGRVTGGICEAKNPANGGYEWAPGGNLYMEGGAKVYVKGGAEISGGSANDGGAGGDGNNIYLTGKSTMELDACVIRNTVAGVSSTRYSINADNGTLHIREGALITNASGVASILNLRTGTNNTTNIYMSGGTIENGTAGNVYLYTNDTFTMSGGLITGGKAGSGGNVYVTGANAKFTLTDGEIAEGEATGTDGGNVRLADKAFFLMEGGKVSGGSARDGGNFHLGTDTVLEITGGTVTGGESGASGSGGNIAVAQATLTVTGGLIEKGVANKGGNINTNNVNASITISNKARIEKGHATSRGGNLCVDMRGCKKLEIGGEAKITGGTATTYGGNICLYINGAGTKKAGTFTMTGGTVEGGTAQYGDNVYVRGYDATYTGAFVLSGGTVGAGGEGSCGNSIYLNDQYSFLQLGSATVRGGIHAEKGNVTLKGAPTVDKTGTGYTYGIKLGNGIQMDLAGMTGGTVYVTATTGKVIAKNLAKDLTANVISEVATAKVTYDATGKTLSFVTK